MSDIFIGQRYRRIGEHDRIWVVTGTVEDTKDHRPFALLVSDDGKATLDVEFAHLEDPELYEHLPV
ncbi:MAG: hypothetical protein ACR2PM_01085 [Hyphomicrobiales bacterium]